MLFKPELAQKVIEQRKTQTRRLVKPGDVFYEDHPRYPHRTFVMSSNGRVRWEVGKDYAVQNGRGKPTLQYAVLPTADGPHYQIVNTLEGDLFYSSVQTARIKLIEIRRDEARNIDPGDAIWEGFASRLEFLATWCAINDKGIMFYANEETSDFRVYLNKTTGFNPGWRDMNSVALWHVLLSRPSKFYDSWALTFQLVK